MNTSHQPSNYLLYGVMLMLLVFVARIQELFVFLLPLRLGMMSVFISVLLFLISSKPGAQVPLSMIPQVKIVLAIFALILVSVPFSVWPGQSFNRVEYFLLTVIFFLLSIYSVNNPADLRKLLWAFIGGVVLLAFFTINSTGAGRHSASATYDPNDIAMLFVITLPIIYFFMTNQNGIAKIIAFLFMLTIIFAFILTGSRGGFLGFFVIMMLIFFMDKFRSWTVKILILGVLIFSFVQFAPDTYWERISTILNYEEDYNMTSETGRKTIWLQGLGLMKDNPVTGVGAGAFTTAMGYAYGERGFKWSTAHNAFVEIGAELGIGGFVLFIWLILSSVYRLRRLQRKYLNNDIAFYDHVWLTTALQISLAGYAVTAMFLSAAYFPMFYFLIALCCILEKMDIIFDGQAAEAELVIQENNNYKR